MANVYFFGKKTGTCNFLTLTGQAGEAMLELGPDGGVENLIKALDNIHLKDKDYSVYEAYETFEKFKPSPSTTITIL